MPGWGGRKVPAALYRRMIGEEAARCGVDPREAVSGRLFRAGVVVRLRVWRRLAERGASLEQIARAAGMDRSTVSAALRHKRLTQMGRETKFWQTRKKLDPWAEGAASPRRITRLVRSVGA